MEVKGERKVETTNNYILLENLDCKVDINRTSECGRQNINISGDEKLGYYQLKGHKPWFHNECLNSEI
jgi:hypothetical protein